MADALKRRIGLGLLTAHGVGVMVGAGIYVLVGAGVIAGGLLLPVAQLAEMTSALLLAVFVLVNAALIAMKRRRPRAPFTVPLLVPVFGLLAALAALVVAVQGLA